MRPDAESNGLKCRASQGWLRDLVEEMRGSFAVRKTSDRSQSDELYLRDRAEVLYEALLTTNFDLALEIAESMPSAAHWHDVASFVVAQIAQNWETDAISPLRVIDAFWTLKRALDHRERRVREDTRDLGQVEKIAIFVPPVDEHSLGARLLGDQLREYGVDVAVLVETKKAELYELLDVERFDLLAISASYDLSLKGLGELIQEARIVSSNPDLKVLVGGQVFTGKPDTYDFLGADYVQHPKAEAVRTILRVLASEHVMEDQKHA